MPAKVYWRRDEEDKLDQLLRRFIIVDLKQNRNEDFDSKFHPLDVLKEFDAVSIKIPALNLPPLPAVPNIPTEVVIEVPDEKEGNALMESLSAMRATGT